MATHSSVLAWRIPGMGEPGGLPSMGLHRVGHYWSDLAVAAAAYITSGYHIGPFRYRIFPSLQKILLETTALECISQVPSICTNLCNTALPLAYWKEKNEPPLSVLLHLNSYQPPYSCGSPSTHFPAPSVHHRRILSFFFLVFFHHGRILIFKTDIWFPLKKKKPFILNNI